MSPRQGENGKLRFRVLRLARWSLLVIAAFTVAAASAYVWVEMRKCNGEKAAGEVFEFVKVGLLPLAVLILTHYFRKEGGAGDGN